MCLAVYLHSLHTAMYDYTSAGAVLPVCVRYLHSSAIACVHMYNMYSVLKLLSNPLVMGGNMPISCIGYWVLGSSSAYLCTD